MKSREQILSDAWWAARAAYAQHAVLTEFAGAGLDAALKAWEAAQWQPHDEFTLPVAMRERVIFDLDSSDWRFSPAKVD
jgi:hypothetical protein